MTTASGHQTSSRLRVVKFSLVGGLGIALQLAVLTALTRLGVHYLLATALAVESAVLHNFLWHQRYTWSDRPATAPSAIGTELLRFHLGNGAVSLAGNLLFMRFLVGTAGLPVPGANLITIAACGLANFLLSDRWVFPNVPASSPEFVARTAHTATSPCPPVPNPAPGPGSAATAPPPTAGPE